MKHFIFSLLLLSICSNLFAQDKVTKCRFYSFTFGNIKFDSVNIRESLTFKGDLVAINSDRYSLIFFENYTMKMELVGKDFPIDVEDTVFFDRTKNLMYIFKEHKAYPILPWQASGISWVGDSALINSEGRTAFLKKSLPPNVFPMPRVSMGIGVYRYASKKFFLKLEDYQTTRFDFSAFVKRTQDFPIQEKEMDTMY